MGKNLIATLGLITTLGLSGCNSCIQQDAREAEKIKEMNMKDLEKGPEMVDYFAQINTFEPAALTSGDFDGDKDLDFIIAGYINNSGGKTGLYFFENDGKGNFKLRQYEKKK